MEGGGHSLPSSSRRRGHTLPSLINVEGKYSTLDLEKGGHILPSSSRSRDETPSLVLVGVMGNTVHTLQSSSRRREDISSLVLLGRGVGPMGKTSLVLVGVRGTQSLQFLFELFWIA